MSAEELIAELAKHPPTAEVMLEVNNDDDERMYSPVNVVYDKFGDQFITINIEEV